MCAQPPRADRTRAGRAAVDRASLSAHELLRAAQALRTAQRRADSADRTGVKLPTQRNLANRLVRPAQTDQVGVVHLLRVGPLRWEAWSLGLVNPRHGLTRRAALRRAQADLDHEWRTGHVARGQREPV